MTLALLGVISACVRGAAYQDELEAAARGSALRRARSFIAVVGSADPDEINKHLTEGIEFRPYPGPSRDSYSFFWNGRNVIGPFPLEKYKDAKTLNLSIEDSGRTIRVFGKHYYKRFIVTSEGISYSDGEVDEVLADLERGGFRSSLAARWFSSRPSPRAVPGLVKALDEPLARYLALQALRRTAFQSLERKADWERWYEVNRSRSREEWRGDGRRKCLGLLESDKLAARIEGAKLARLIGGMEEDVRKALVFPDETYTTSVAQDESGHALVITNRTAQPALIAVADRGCSLSFLLKLPAEQGLRCAGGSRFAGMRCGPPAEHYLRILKPGESRTVPIKLPKVMKPGEYAVTAYVRDALNGRKYEARFDCTVP